MIPAQLAPGREFAEPSLDEMAGSYAVIEDLCSDFQGAALGYPFFAVLLLLLSLATGYYRWSENNTAIQLLITLVPFTALMAVSIHSWIWLFKLRRRLKAMRQRMQKLHGEQH
jgi:hypothetical protein